MDMPSAHSVTRSFERHLCAANRSQNTIDSYLESLRQAEAFLAARDRTLLDARRVDLGAFLADLLTRRAPSTVTSLIRTGLRLVHGHWSVRRAHAVTSARPGCARAGRSAC